MNNFKRELPFILFLLFLFVAPTGLHRIFPPVIENEGLPVTSPEVGVTEARARAVAQKQLPQGEHLKTELEHEKGTAVYEVTLVKDHQQKVFLVDARQAKVSTEP